MSMNEMESKIRELDQGGIGLIERKKQGQSRPTRIYVKNFTLPPEPGQPRQSDQTPPEGPQTAESQPSRPLETSGLDSKFSVPNKTEGNQTDQNHPEASISPSSPSRASPSAGAHRRMRIDEMDRYRERIRENIGYPLLVQERPYDREEIDGYVELMAETCASRRAYIRVNGEEMPTELVRDGLLKLDGEHIRYVMDSLRQNTTQVVNIRAYTLAALYNAPVTISQYYTAQVSYDMAQGFGGA